MILETASLVDKSTERPVGVRTSCIEQQAKAADGLVGIDALVQGAGWIDKVRRDGLDEQMRNRMKQHICPAGKQPISLARLAPSTMHGNQCVDPRLVSRALKEV